MSVRHRRYSHHPIVNPGPEVKPTLLWTAVDELLAGATRVRGILAHKLGPNSEANRLRRRAESLPAQLILEERAATLCALVARPLVERIRAGSESPLLLIKGPEIASSYPGRARTFGDVDILDARRPDTPEGVARCWFRRGLRPRGDRSRSQASLDAAQVADNRVSYLEAHRAPNWPNSSSTSAHGRGLRRVRPLGSRRRGRIRAQVRPPRAPDRLARLAERATLEVARPDRRSSDRCACRRAGNLRNGREVGNETPVAHDASRNRCNLLRW